MKKFVALYGGSFNPSTDAHRDIGLHLLKKLRPDEVWYLVSPQNPFKPKEGMAPFHHRIAMAKLNVEDHPQLVVQDIEAKYALAKPDGVIETAETLRNLTRDFPNYRFVWTMGADNFAEFHGWGDAQYIRDHFPVIIIPRPPHTEDTLAVSESATLISRLKNASDTRFNNGWYYMDDFPLSHRMATHWREELAQGKTPDAMRPAVAQYALKRGVYALS